METYIQLMLILAAIIGLVSAERHQQLKRTLKNVRASLSKAESQLKLLTNAPLGPNFLNKLGIDLNTIEYGVNSGQGKKGDIVICDANKNICVYRISDRKQFILHHHVGPHNYHKEPAFLVIDVDSLGESIKALLSETFYRSKDDHEKLVQHIGANLLLAFITWRDSAIWVK